MTGTVAVVVASFERPRMLSEALDSIDGADMVIVADDGSTFDVAAVAMLHSADLVLYGPKRQPAERMVTPSCGRLLNEGLRQAAEAGMDYAIVLSDDDLLAPGFPRAAAAALDADPGLHMVRADWATFQDGEQPDPTKLCTFTFDLPLTAGCFAYRLSCGTVEGCWWDENSLAVHDGAMLVGYLRHHGYRAGRRPAWLGYLDMLAGYRREHPKTVTNHSLYGGDRYLPSAEALFATPGGME